MTELKPVHPEEGSCPSRMTHDLARLQQAFDEEAASLHIRRFHIGSFAAEPATLVMNQLTRETPVLAQALSLAALAFIGLWLVIPA